MGVNKQQVSSLTDELMYMSDALSITVTSTKFEDYSNVAKDIAEQIDLINDSTVTTREITELIERGKKSCKKRFFVEKMINLLAPKLELLATKVNRDLDVDASQSALRIEALRLQLDIIEQKGYYAVLQNKEKVKVQEEIILAFGQLIQELFDTEDLVGMMIEKLKPLASFSEYEYVTKPEEEIIAACYSDLQNALININ